MIDRKKVSGSYLSSFSPLRKCADQRMLKLQDRLALSIMVAIFTYPGRSLCFTWSSKLKCSTYITVLSASCRILISTIPMSALLNACFRIFVFLLVPALQTCPSLAFIVLSSLLSTAFPTNIATTFSGVFSRPYCSLTADY